jgi:hypothetical protein
LARKSFQVQDGPLGGEIDALDLAPGDELTLVGFDGKKAI